MPGGRGGWQKGRTAIVFAVVVYHEHHLPLKDVIVVDEAARDARQVLALLDLLELPLQQRSGRGGGRHGGAGRCPRADADTQVGCRASEGMPGGIYFNSALVQTRFMDRARWWRGRNLDGRPSASEGGPAEGLSQPPPPQHSYGPRQAAACLQRPCVMPTAGPARYSAHHEAHSLFLHAWPYQSMGSTCGSRQQTRCPRLGSNIQENRCFLFDAPRFRRNSVHTSPVRDGVSIGVRLRIRRPLLIPFSRCQSP